MKKSTLILAAIGVAFLTLNSCKKDNPKDVFHDKMVGTWVISEARLDPADPWVDVSSANDVSVITETTISSHNTDYTIINQTTFEMSLGTNGTQFVIVSFEGDCMVWTFCNKNQLKLCH